MDDHIEGPRLRRGVRLGIWAVVLAVSVLVVAWCVAPDWESGTSEWSLLRTSGRSLELRVWVGSSTCNEYEGINVDETARSVTITAHIKRERNADCTDDLTSKEVTVVLERSLGRRTLSGCAPTDALVRGRDDRSAPCDRPMSTP